MSSLVRSRLLTRNFRLYNAEQFKEAFLKTPPENLYLFIGRVHPWPDNDTPTTLEQTVTAVEYDPWIDMIAAKKINPNDMSLVVPRVDWIAGRTYQQYNNIINVDAHSNIQNYVLTSNGNVYKCIFNNGGAVSTVEPTGVSTFIFDTADGYKWKFMYTITGAEALQFVTPQFIPVKRITVDDSSAQFTVQQAAANGAIHIIDVVASGNNYLERKNTVGGAESSSVIILDSGASTVDNFFTGQGFFVSSGLGAGQLRNIINYEGELRRVTLDTALSITPNTSSLFHISPRITISGDGNGATAYANVESGQIRKINMVNVGSNYTKASAAITGSQGSGAVARPIISPPGGHGSDPVSELYGHNVMLSVRLDGTEGNTFPSNNEFRVIGLLVNPRLSSNGDLATDVAYNQTTRLNVINLTGALAQDEIINGQVSGASARVVYFANTTSSGTTGDINVVAIDGVFQNETITGNTSGAVGNIISITAGDLLPFSGSILYLENRPETIRTFDQIEDIKLTLQY
jgi:hypothetical protein